MTTIVLDSGWLAARASEVPQTGVELTTSAAPTAATDGWMEAVVPGTILTTLLKNKLIPDPFYGMENENVADIADAGREHYTFWFCTSFVPPESARALAWLQFRAINYSADVYVNGHKTTLPGGMFRRHKLNISPWLRNKTSNYLAILVHPPDHPGRIPPEGGQGGDHDIAKDVAAQYVEGWDWIAPIRDRNTGLWDEVSLLFTGPVTIKDPHVVTSFHDHYTRAYMHVATELVNSSSKDTSCTIQIDVSVDLEDEYTSVEHLYSTEVSVPAGSTVAYTFPPMFFYKPRLWWPNGMGEQPLYNVDIVVGTGDTGESDTWSHRVGFRHIDSHIDSSTGGRLFEVNGQPVFIRGGNWIVSDGLLRLTKERYNTEVGFHADMNMNMIRVWGGALAERPAFYDACDERGMLVWQEFWITGDCNGRGVAPSDQNWPLDHALFLTCARDTVKLLRNHASLALWVGGNEQYPAADINEALTSELALNPSFEPNAGAQNAELGSTKADMASYLDGTRVYIKGSLWNGFADGEGGWTDGPYTIQNPEAFFAEGYYPYAFNPEIGSVGVPNVATIRATMPPEAWAPPEIVEIEDGYVQEVPNSTWVYHKYIAYSDADTKVRHQIAAYGKPKDLDDFCYKAQLVNYIQYRALYESWNSRMWEKYTGVLIWKTQNPWPGLRGGLYDFLLDQTGGFFGVKSAAEPVHIQLNLVTHVVEIVNTTKDLLNDVQVEASVWELDGGNPQSTVKRLSAPPFKTTRTFEISYEGTSGAQPVFFVVLKLSKNSHQLVSRNFYWLHLQGADYSSLEGEFRARKVAIEFSALATQRDDSVQIIATVKNLSDKNTRSESPRDEPLHEPTPTVAFWLHLCILNDDGGAKTEEQRLLPVNYSNNFVSLLPGEAEDLHISFRPKRGFKPIVVLRGWNIAEVQVPLESLL